MRTIRLDIEYDGTDFAGWQRQSGTIPTVQGTIEAVLRKILQEEISLTAAGRTDKGVHARQQVANCILHSSMGVSRMRHSLNCLLPSTIRICQAIHVADTFHARYSATARVYRYFLLEQPSALYGRFTGCSFGKLDLDRMQLMAASVLGIHDFSAFSRDEQDSASRLCNVFSCSWHRYRHLLVLQIVANRFLRSMVRYLVDAMIRGGKGELSLQEFQRMLSCNSVSGKLAPAAPSGLFLWRVHY